MIKEIKEKIMAIKNWIKTKAKKVLIATGIIGVALAAGEIIQPTIPSIVAEGQTISFPYTDENSNENLIIRTDQAVYNPLWAWNGFDVYVAVENKSGISQPVSFQSFFSKDFSVEEVSVLNPNATSTIDICPKVATSSKETVECYKEIVLGVWNPIVQQQFLREEYDKAISLNQIPVKQKIGDRITGNFIDYSLKDQFSYYKLRVKANEFFSQEEFSIEAIGQDGSYGLCDPTVLTDNFNSYNDGNLQGQGSWTNNTNPQVQTGSADNPEGSGVGKEVKCALATNNEWMSDKIGTATADGRIVIYFKTSNTTYNDDYFWILHATLRAFMVEAIGTTVKFITGGGGATIGTISANTWYPIIMEWRSSDHYCRGSLDDITFTEWAAMENAITPDRVRIDAYSPGGAHDFYFDYIAENPLAGGGTAEPQMNVIIIE
jgi:hypothetical protein